MRKFLVLTITAVLVVLMGSSAQATIRDITDPPSDVVKVTEGDSEDIFEPVSRAEGDIVFTRIQHTATTMVVYVRFRQLTVPKQYAEYSYWIKGNNGRSVSVAIYTRHALPQGTADALNNEGRDCALSHRINYAGDSAWVRFARGCLKNPKYIRVQAHSGQRRISRTDEITQYYDVTTRDGLDNYDQLGDTWTPWVVTG